MEKINSINDIIVNIYTIIYRIEDIDKFELNFWTYKIYSIIREKEKYQYNTVNIIDNFLNNLCIYLNNIIINDKYNKNTELQILKEEYKKLLKRSNEDIRTYINNFEL